MLVAAAVVGGSLAAMGPAASSPAFAADGSCADGSVVVVDLTDLGGPLEVRCAEGAQESGRVALLAAGFAIAESQPGFVCAINALPDPCPETFDGSFWAYWHSAPGGEWTSYQVGADSSSPARGEIEGWRYNKGDIPPGITPDEAAATVSPAPTPEVIELPNVAIPGADEHVTNSEGTADDQRATHTLAIVATSLSLIALIIALIILRWRRRSGGIDSPEVRD